MSLSRKTMYVILFILFVLSLEVDSIVKPIQAGQRGIAACALAGLQSLGRA